MFDTIDFSKDIDSIVLSMEKNTDKAREVAKQIDDLKIKSISESNDSISSFGFKMCEEEKVEEIKEEDDETSDIIDLYRLAKPNKEEIEEILPSSDDYSYQEVLLKLYATSIKEIKEMSEMGLEEESYNHEDVQSFIENEKKKMAIIWELLNPVNEEKEDINLNHIILMPNMNGKMRILEDLDKIPSEYYDEIHDLIYSIIDGTFKRVKRFTSTNTEVAGMSEVRGFKGRVFFQRIKKDLYVLVCAFVKKTTNDHGYQDYIRTRIQEYKNVEDALKDMVDDSKFMELNDLYVQELWNKLGYADEYKQLKKKRDEV